jgi:putative FmdB family regulatory protein
MPTYDYFCDCGEKEEIFHGMMEEPEIICKVCGKKMKKGYTGMTFHLKGTGWVSKGTGTASKPKHFKEIGVGVPESMTGIVSDEVKRNAVAIRRGK